MPKLKTNEQKLRKLMNYGKHGAMTQVFIMCAVEYYAKQCINAKPEDLTNGLIDGAYWQAIAADVLEGLK